MFGAILTSIITIMHLYFFWRVASVPWVRQRIPGHALLLIGLALWALFFLGRTFGHGGAGSLAALLEFLGMAWMGILFLTVVPLVLIDLITGFGFFRPRLARSLRGWALLAGAVLSMAAFVQGLRPPVIRSHDIFLPGLPPALDNTVAVVMSDMHLGSLLGKGWLTARIAQAEALRPDIILLLGDLFEGHGAPEAPFVSAFQTLRAPLGVWAIPGNHEFHGGDKLRLFKESGFRTLHNAWAEAAPGLILAGVTDLTRQRRNGRTGDTVSETLAGHPEGAVIFLSHTPWDAQKAAKAGAGLMLSGHTHGGQIWPFDFLVRLRYPLLEGRYEVNGMPVIVCRGTGTWGPRMRLWSPGEILRITLKSAPASTGPR